MFSTTSALCLLHLIPGQRRAPDGKRRAQKTQHGAAGTEADH